MRNPIAVLSCAILFAVASGMARADSTVVNFTANGTAAQNGSGLLGVVSTAFAEFNPSLGTLTSVTLDLSGTADYMNARTINDALVQVTPGIDPQIDLSLPVHGSGFLGDGSFAFSSNANIDPINFSFFEGAGTTTLNLNFIVANGTLTTTDTSGTITYNYTPNVAPTPEPSSLMLAGTGLLGLAGVVRRRFR